MFKFTKKEKFPSNLINELIVLMLNYKGEYYLPYSSIKNRIDSFKCLTLKDTSEQDLVNAGFFYLGANTNIAQCAFCGIKLKYWDLFDVPIDEHAKTNPDCIYVKTYKLVKQHIK